LPTSASIGAAAVPERTPRHQPLAGLAARTIAALPLPQFPTRPSRAAVLAVVGIPLTVAAALALHAVGPTAHPTLRSADLLPPPVVSSNTTGAPAASASTSSPQTGATRLGAAIAADLFQTANAAARLSIAQPPVASGPSLDDLEQALARVAEAQLALDALNQSAQQQIAVAQSQIAEAQRQLAAAKPSVTPTPLPATATPAPTSVPTSTPTPAPVATPVPPPYTDAQIAQARADLAEAQQRLADVERYNAAVAVPPPTPAPSAVGIAVPQSPPAPGTLLATPTPTPPPPVDPAPYRQAVADAQANLNAMLAANSAALQANAAVAPPGVASTATAPTQPEAADASTATPVPAMAENSVTEAAPTATPGAASTPAPASAAPAATAIPGPVASATGTDADTTDTEAQSQAAIAAVQAAPPSPETLQAAQNTYNEAKRAFETLLQQARPEVAAQVDKDPMTALQKLLSGVIKPGPQLANGFIWPAKGSLTQGFGMTAFAAAGEYGGAGHTGIDIGQAAGMPVVAAAGGTVTFSGGVPNAGYGYYVVIDNGNGYTTLYAHLLAPSYLKAGDHVAQGQMIGLSGSTGHSTGPHLHFEIRLDGVPIDPLPLLAGALPRPLQP